MVAVAANTQVAVAYLAVLFPVLDDPFLKSSAVVIFIIFTTAVNLVGKRTSAGTLGVMTAVKLFPLVGLIVVGLATRDPAMGFSLPEFTEFESVFLLTYYAYMSFENGTFPAGELRDPKLTIRERAHHWQLILIARAGVFSPINSAECALVGVKPTKFPAHIQITS